MLTDVTGHIVWREVAGVPFSMAQNICVLKIEAAGIFKNWIIYTMFFFFFPEYVLARLASDYNLIIWIPWCVCLLGQNTPVAPMRGIQCLWYLYFSVEYDPLPSVFYHESIPKRWSILRLLSKSGFWVLKARSQILYCVVFSGSLKKWPAGLCPLLFLLALLVLTMYGKNRPYSPLLIISTVYMRDAALTVEEEEALLASSGWSLVLTFDLILLQYLLPQVWLVEGQHTILLYVLQLFRECSVSWCVSLLLISGSCPFVEKSDIIW